MKCPKTNSTGGPIISFETTEKPDAMAIVWMSIHSDHSPIDSYRVYLNGQMCGNPVVPDPGSDRCKVVIEGCQTANGNGFKPIAESREIPHNRGARQQE